MGKSIKLEQYWDADHIILDNAGTKITDVNVDTSVTGNTSYSGYMFFTEMGDAGTTSVATNTYSSVDVTFNIPFIEAPTVIITAAHNSTSYLMGNTTTSVTNITETGFTVNLYNASSAARWMGFSWIAFGKR